MTATNEKAQCRSETASRGRRVKRARTCRLSVDRDLKWRYATDNAAAITALWQTQREENPGYFNGTVFLLARWHISDDGVFEGVFLEAEFKQYLHWRLNGFEPCGVWDGFGSGVLQSRDGGIVLGQQSAGNVNAGLSYPPSGFIDQGDVTATGAIDIDSSIAREIFEETGIDCVRLSRLPGYWLTFDQAQVSIAVEYLSGQSTLHLKQQIERHLASETVAELEAVHVVVSTDELSELALPEYAETLLPMLLAGTKG